MLDYVLIYSVVHALQNPIASNTIPEVLRALLNGIISISIPLLVLFYVYLGFKFVTSLGKPEEIKKNREWALWGIVGTLLIVSAYGLYGFLDGTIKRITETSYIDFILELA